MNEAEKRFTENTKVLDYNLIVQCMHCGLCLPQCPTYKILNIETDSPRGRIALMKAVKESNLQITPKFVNHMYVCLACRACETACPAGVQYGHMIESARALIEESRGSSRLKKFILRKVVPNPPLMEILMLPVRLFHLTGLSKLVRALRVLKIFPLLDRMERFLPPLKWKTLRGSIPLTLPCYGKKKGTVGFFLGCAMNLIFSDVSRKSIELLRHKGYDVITPPETKCCGAPHLNVGDRKTAEELAKFNIDLFKKYNFDYIITDCAGCGTALKEFRIILEHDPDYRDLSSQFSEKVKDICEVLSPLREEERKELHPVPKRVTYDDPCHLIHGQNVRQQPRDLIKAVPEIDFTELKDSDWCCGSAGTYFFSQNEMSERILRMKFEEIGKTGAECVITANPGCLLQLKYGAQMVKQNVDIIHIVELLAEAKGIQ